MDAKERVFDIMKKEGRELRPGDIATLAGLEKKDVEKAVKTLNTEGRIYSPKRCFWQAK
jgi:hypothetical protein